MSKHFDLENKKSDNEIFASIVDIVHERAEQYPEREILHFLPDGKLENVLVWNYEQFDQRARAMAVAIQSLNYGEGHPVLLMLPPGLDYISSFFGCLYAGSIAVPMSPPGLTNMARSFARVARIMEDSGSRVFITNSKLLKAVEEMVAKIGLTEKVSIICSDTIDDSKAKLWKYVALHEDTLGWLQYTSGSTSIPKGVVVTHGNIIANTRSIVNSMHIEKDTPSVGWLPPFHDMGLVGCIIMPILRDCLCVTMPPMVFLRKPFAWLQAVSHYKAQISGGPNFAYDHCCEHISDAQLEQLDLSNLRICFCGSEAIRQNTIQRFFTRFVKTGFDPHKFYPCYGLAENTLFTTGEWSDQDDCIVTIDRDAYSNGEICTVEKAHPKAWSLVSCGVVGIYNDVRIVNPETKCEVKPGELGEIWIKGECVAPAYWNQPELSKEVLHATLTNSGEGDFLRTGDLGFFLNGHLYVSGRCKEMIILNGRNFFPHDLQECVLQNVSGLEQNGAAAFSIETPSGEGLVVAFETRMAESEYEGTLAAIRMCLNEEFSVLPHAIVLCKRNSIPKTTSGKIQQAQSRKLYLEGELNVLTEWKSPLFNGSRNDWGDVPPTLEDAGQVRKITWENWLRRGLSARLGIDKDSIGLHTPFSSLGMNSATAVALTAELQELSGKILPATLFYDQVDVAGLAAFMAGAENCHNCTVQTGQEIQTSQDIAIIGMACRLPHAENPEAFKDMLFNGIDAISEMPEDRVQKNKYSEELLAQQAAYGPLWGGYLNQIDRFDPSLFGISPREAKEMDPQQRMLLELSWEALERAGIVPDSLRHSNTGVFTGISSSDYETLRFQSGHSFNPYVGTGNARSIASNRLSYVYGLEGPSMSVDSACSSSLLAMHLACRSLQNKECSMAFACGVNVLLCTAGNLVFKEANLMAPDGRCKTFSSDANGYVRSEGGVVLLLKTLDQALADNAPILGIVRGSAVNQDGNSNGLTAPSRQAQAKLLQSALNVASLKPSDIDYFEAHGTGTALGDPIEFNAISDVYSGSHSNEAPLLVSSVKTNIGHLEAAAGLAGVCRVLVSLEAQAISPILHCHALNPEISPESIPALIPVNTTPWPKKDHAPRRAAVSSFGFGGTNVHAIIEEGPTTLAQCTREGDEIAVLALSASSEEQLRDVVTTYATWDSTGRSARIIDDCFTSCVGRQAMPYRASFVCGDDIKKLSVISLDNELCYLGHVAENVENHPIVFVFDEESASVTSQLAIVIEKRKILQEQIALLGIDDTGKAQKFLHVCALAQAWESMVGAPVGVVCCAESFLAAAYFAGCMSLEQVCAVLSAKEMSATEALVALDEDWAPRMPFFDVNRHGLVTKNDILRALQGDFKSDLECDQTGKVQGDSLRDLVLNIFGEALTLVFAKDTIDLVGIVLADGMSDADRSDNSDLLYAFGADGESHAQKAADILADLWVTGHDVHWSAVYAHSGAVKTLLPTYPFRGQSFWFEESAEKDAEVFAVKKEEPNDIALRSHNQSQNLRISEAKVTEQCEAKSFGIADSECDASHTTEPTLGVETTPVQAIQRPTFEPLSDEEYVDLLQAEACAVLHMSADTRLDVQMPLIRAGFDSLLLMEFAQRVCRKLGIAVSSAVFMNSVNLAEIVKHLGTIRASSSAPINDVIVPDSVNSNEPFPLTDVQHAYWLGRSETMVLGGVSCSNYIEGDFQFLDITRLENALTRLVQRHDMLRCIIRPDGQQEVLHSVPPYHIELDDISHLDAQEKEDFLVNKRDVLSHAVLACDKAPLFDIRATQFDEKTIRLHVKLDLLIADAFSFTILLRDIAGWYVDPTLEKQALSLTFRDCVVNHEKMKALPEWEEDRNYWLARLESLPQGPDLPLAQEPSSLEAPHFTRRTARLSKENWKVLRKLGREHSLTPSGILLAAFSLVLVRWCAHPDFCLMLTTFDRRQQHPEMHEIVGDFTQLLLLEVHKQKGTSFLEHATALGKQLAQDLGHSRFTGVDVLRELAKNSRSGMTSSRSAVVFTSALPLTSDLSSEDSFAALNTLGAKHVYSISQTPQVWLDHQVYELNNELVYTWDVVEALFPEGMIDALFEMYGTFLHDLCSSTSDSSQNSLWVKPLPLDSLPICQEQIRNAVNNTYVEYTQKTLFERFLAHTAQDASPDLIITETMRFTRKEVESLSRKLASHLQMQGIGKNHVVAVMMEKGWEQIVSVMAIARAGATYLPVDGSLPEKRISYMFDNAKVSLCLVQSHLQEKSTLCGATPFIVDKDTVEHINDEGVLPQVAPDSLAYIIYTSGSTGNPKGVMVEHKAAYNTIDALESRLDLNVNDRVLALASLSFDLSVFDVFGMSGTGGALVVPSPEHLQSPAEWCRLMREHNVTIWNTTPSLLQLLLDYLEEYPDQVPPSLRLTMLSGDWIPLTMPKRLRALWPSLRIAAMGGATEASIWSNIHMVEDVPSTWSSIPYGKPLENQGYCVLDEDLCPCPDYVAGSLFITGAGLARGYFNDAEKTASSFFEHPRTGQRLYSTGDLGRYWSDGTLEFLGRRDSQVKINGFRIELGEIENAMFACSGVQNAAVIDVKSAQGDRLAAFVSFATENGGDQSSAQASGHAHSETEEEFLARKQAMLDAGISIIDATERLTYKQAGHNVRKDLERLDKVSLANPPLEHAMSLYSKRISSRLFINEPVKKEPFAELMGALGGLNTAQWPVARYRYGSAGWTYAVQAYVMIKPHKIEGFEDGGCYYYHPLENALIKISATPEGAEALFPGQNKDIFASGAFALFLVADMNAIEPLYGRKSGDFVLIEAGLISQMLEETAMKHELGLCQIGELNFASLFDGFALTEHHRYLHCLIGGAVRREAGWNFSHAMEESLLTHVETETSGLVDHVREQLHQWLPEYMVPQSITSLPAIPLTSNGKVDRKRLAQLAQEKPAQAIFTAPEGQQEESLSKLIGTILGKDRIGAVDNFFDLGASSLQLVLFQRRIGELFNKQIAITDIFAHPNVRDLAAFLFDEKDESNGLIEMAKKRAQMRKGMRNRRG